MKTAIVILNWNGERHLDTYLPFVREFTDKKNCEIVIADNGSNDLSIDFVKLNYPEFRIIELDKNYGFAGGYNRALDEVDADIFCLLNSDVRVTKGWMDPIINLFDTDKQIAAVQPKILSDRDWSMFEHAGAAGGFIDKYGYPFCRGRIMNVLEYDRGQYNKQTDIFWASGACMFIRAELFRSVGGFDDDYFAHMEEIDLCWRLKNQDYRIVFCPDSKVFHWGGATLEYNNPHKLFLNFRNSLWTLYKNYTGSFLHWVMLKRLLIDTFAVVKFLLTFEWKNMMAVISAHMAFHRSKSELRKKRKVLMSKVSKTEHTEMLPQSVVWQFFLYSHKVFDNFKKFKKAVLKTSPN